MSKEVLYLGETAWSDDGYREYHYQVTDESGNVSHRLVTIASLRDTDVMRLDVYECDATGETLRGLPEILTLALSGQAVSHNALMTSLGETSPYNPILMSKGLPTESET